MNTPSPANVFAAFFAADPENQPVPYTLTPEAEAALEAADPEPEAEL